MQRNMGWMVVGGSVMFGTIAILSLLVVHPHEKKKVLLGIVGIIATGSLYVSPLSIVVSNILYLAFIMYVYVTFHSFS